MVVVKLYCFLLGVLHDEDIHVLLATLGRSLTLAAGYFALLGVHGV